MDHRARLDHETVLCRFTEKEKIAFSGQPLLPVIRDGDTVVHDSWSIACFLEDTYPDRPSLFGCDIGRATTRFYDGAGHAKLLAALAIPLRSRLPVLADVARFVDRWEDGLAVEAPPAQDGDRQGESTAWRD